MPLRKNPTTSKPPSRYARLGMAYGVNGKLGVVKATWSEPAESPRFPRPGGGKGKAQVGLRPRAAYKNMRGELR